MLTEKGQAKIMDFGLAKLEWGVDLTKTATIMGTVSYMSPEQAKGGKVDHRTDIWSLGAMLYEMSTGQNQFFKIESDSFKISINQHGIIKNFVDKNEVDNLKQIELPVTLHPGQTIKYTGGDTAIIYSKNWQKIKEVEIDATAFTISKGKHSLSFDCRFAESKDILVKLELRFIGNAEKVKVN